MQNLFRKTNIVTFLAGLGTLLFVVFVLLSGASRVMAQETNATSTPLIIYNEHIEEVLPNVYALVWETSVPATSKVFFGLESVAQPGLALMNSGYRGATAEVYAPLVTHHSVALLNQPYGLVYVRAMSRAGDRLAYSREISVDLRDNGNVNAVIISTSLVVATPTPISVQTPISNPGCLISGYAKLGGVNNTDDVVKIQTFLKNHEGANLNVSGVFDQQTKQAVSVFQQKYASEILAPWGLTSGTGNVYILTKKKINDLSCGQGGLTPAEYSEVANSIIARLSTPKTPATTAPAPISPTPKETPVVVPVTPILETDSVTPIILEKATATPATPLKPIEPITPSVNILNTETKTEPIVLKTPIKTNQVATSIAGTVVASDASESLGSLVFQMPISSNDLLRSFLSFIFILAIIYILGNIINGGRPADISGLRKNRIRKLVTYIIGALIFIPIAFLLDLPYLTIPLGTVALLLVIVLAVYASFKPKSVYQATMSIEPSVIKL